MSSPASIQFEELAPRHETGLTDLFRSLKKNGDGGLFYPHPLNDVEARRLCRYSGHDQYFVAIANGVVVGYGLLRGWDEGYSVPSLGLATHPDHRCQGVAETLMRELIRQSRNRGASQLRVTVDASRGRFIKFCERYGFAFSPLAPGRLLGMLNLEEFSSERTLSVGICSDVLIGWSGGVDLLVNLVCSMRAANNTAKIYLLAPGAAPDEPKSFWSAATYAVKDAIKLAIGRPRLKERPDITRDRSVAKLVEMIRGRDIDVPVRYCSGLDEDLASASRELDLDVVFLAMRSPLIRPVCAVIGYVPDYQHRYLPHLFSAREIAHRDQVSARLIADSDAMIMNARTVAEDMRNFSEGPLPSLHALPFSPTASTEWMEGRPDLLSSYAISGPYFIICNQFWVHKDHLTAFRAIAEVADHHQNVTLVCTGSLLDYRNPTYFEKLQAEVVKLGLVSRIRFLGHVPKRDQIELLKHAVAVVQPTLFEGGPGGGSTYEAVALGQRVLLSDLPVNQEIDSGDVRFFPCGDHVALAKLMNLALDETCIVRNPAALIARSNARLRRNGEAIWASIMAAIIAHKQKACGRTIEL